jgi:secondary thiamine-phosphate synthase enzyme
MDTLTPALVSHHTTVRIPTASPTGFIDLTGRLEGIVEATGLRLGFVSVHTLHTTAAVVVNEHEPLLLGDFAEALERLAPADLGYRHDDAFARVANVVAGERPNGHAHCRALLLGPAACLHVVDGRIRLGRWQRVFLVELDGPRERDVSVLVLGEGGR